MCVPMSLRSLRLCVFLFLFFLFFTMDKLFIYFKHTSFSSAPSYLLSSYEFTTPVVWIWVFAFCLGVCLFNALFLNTILKF